MKTYLWAALAVSLLAAPSAFSQDSPGGGQSAKRMQAMIQKLKEADKDGDGKLSKDEAFGRLKERFDDVDANKDGFLDRDELRTSMQQAGRKMMMQSIVAQLKAADKDGDGKLSKDEAPDQLKEHFAQVDTNSDGFVDKEEVGKALAKLGQMMNWAARVKAADKDGDMKLSKDEAPEELKEHFAEIDDNSDGFIDGGELKSAVQEYMDRQGDEKEESKEEPKKE